MTPRATFLRALPRHGFVPPEADVPADLPGTDPAARSAARVAAFAAEFWAVPAGERVIRWGDLKATAFGPAAVRLTELQAGTCVEPAAQADADAAELAALVKELVTLPPRARAARRFDWLAARAAELRRWRAASRVVLRTDLSLAALEPRLFESLAAGTVPTRVERETWVAARDRWRARKRWRKKWGRRALLAPLPLLAVLMIVAAVTENVRPTSRTRAQPTAYVPLDPAPPPPAPPPAPPVLRGPFSADEVLVFRSYEQCRPNCPMPERYEEWLAAGRPKAGRVP